MALRHVRAGDPITDGVMNSIIDIANRSNLTVADGGCLSLTTGPEGYVLTAMVPRTVQGKITGPISGGSYPFLEQFPGPSGTWTDGTMTDVAVEQNGNTGVPTGKVVNLTWASSGEWLFEYGSC